MYTNEDKFKEILSGTKRKGIEGVLAKLEELKFFEAPASTKFHLSSKGGLLAHSLNVYEAALALRAQAIERKPELEAALPLDSVAICSLLHDTCKTDIYVDTLVSRKNALGLWEKHPGYTTDYLAALPLGHGEKSVIMLLSWGLELTPDEMMAIRWHMSAWDLPEQSFEHKESLRAAKEKCALVSLIQLADGFAAGLLERDGSRDK